MSEQSGCLCIQNININAARVRGKKKGGKKSDRMLKQSPEHDFTLLHMVAQAMLSSVRPVWGGSPCVVVTSLIP